MRPAVRWMVLVAGLALFGSVRAQSAGTTIAGPFSVPLLTSQTISFSTTFKVPTPIQGSYILRVQLSAPNSLTAASLKLNGSQIFSLSDFAGGVTSVDKLVTLLASDSIALTVAGVKGTKIIITVFTVVYPKPISIAPNPLSLNIGASGTLTATLAPAPTASGTLTVTNGTPTVASVPGSISFGPGQTSVAIPVTVLSGGNTIVTASANGGQASATVAVDFPPSVNITSPAANSVFQTPATIQINASAADTDGTVAEVDFYQGGTLIGSATAAPYNFTWTNVTPGSYALTAVATDNQGESTASAAVTIRVNAPPSVAITNPGPGATFTAPATITLLATASDSDGSIASVTLYQGTTAIATVNTVPYSFNWSNVAQGAYTLTAVATDNDGAVTTSAPINITVNSGIAQMYYIVPDHLDTPRLVTDRNQNAVWRWDQGEPFGNDVPNTNPAGVGMFDFPLRFPGQYFDRETNIEYNAMRDFDSAIGRYIESDPISVGLHARMWMAGLASTRLTRMTERPPLAINPYLYVVNNPLKWVDPTGLLEPEQTGPYPMPPGDHCPLVEQVLLGVLPANPIIPVGIAVWLCVYNCCPTCPPKETCLVTQIQYGIYGTRVGCTYYIRRPS